MAGLTRYWTSSSSVVSPNDQPALNAARFACSTAGLRANFCSIHRSVTSVGRPYSHDSTPSANRFLARPASRVDDLLDPLDRRASSAPSSGSGGRDSPQRAVLERVGVVAGLLEVALGERVLVDDDRRAALELRRGSPSAPPGSSPPARSARRPGVRMSREAKWIWNAETPASVPAGARISAGKFGSVARSLPTTAVASVNRLPASCIPSPESPAKRTTTRSRSSTVLVIYVRPSSTRLTHSTRRVDDGSPRRDTAARAAPGPHRRHPWARVARRPGGARPTDAVRGASPSRAC